MKTMTNLSQIDRDSAEIQTGSLLNTLLIHQPDVSGKELQHHMIHLEEQALQVPIPGYPTHTKRFHQ
jgi:hypothetical protein